MTGELLRTSDLPTSVRDEMFGLMCRQFVDVARDDFTADLAGKNWVVLLRSNDGHRLRGFSTLHVYPRVVGGQEVGVVYSGDTVVDGEPGMGSAISKVWIGAVNALRSVIKTEVLYWFLLTSGYRTYRFLPLYWREFLPRHDSGGHPSHQRLLAGLAEDRFGRGFDPRTGIVRFVHPQVLTPELRRIPPNRLADPHVAFFGKANPGHGDGDELACLTELSVSNLTPAGKRMWTAGNRLFEGWEPGR